ncbi:MAG: S-layer homology domain-containing protein, partial [Anaerovoracaceae bacterium]
YTYIVSGLKGTDNLTSNPTATCTSANNNKAGTYTITASGATASDNYTINYVNGTLNVYAHSSGGSSSSDSTTTKTETKNPDGSTTTTVTDKTTGTVTETTKDKDGTTTVVETKKDGSATEKVSTPDGTTGTVATDRNGAVTEVKSTISYAAAADAAKTGEAVTLPVSVPAAVGTAGAPVVNIAVPESADSVKVEIPVASVSGGLVAVLVKADGTEEILKTSIPTDNGVALTLAGNANVKVIDNAKKFVDTDGHWAEGSIDFVTAREIFNGTSDITFTPDNNVSRGQLMTVIARFDGQDTNGGSVWYEKGMNWARASNVSDGSNPNSSLTREQLATMLWRYAGSPASQTNLDRFADAGKVSSYAETAMRWAVETGLIDGVDSNTLSPQGGATRAQLSAIMARYCKNIA